MDMDIHDANTKNMDTLRGYVQFRLVDSVRYPLYQAKETGQWYYVYDKTKYSISIGMASPTTTTSNSLSKGWKMFVQSLTTDVDAVKDKDKDNDDITIMYTVYLSNAFLYEEYVNEIQSSLTTFGSYPSKLYVRREDNRDVTEYSINGKTVFCNIPPTYVPSVLKRHKESIPFY